MRDLGVTQAVAPQVPEFLVPVLVVLTFFGGPKVVAVLSTMGAGIALWLDRVDRRRALRFLAMVGLTLAVSLVVKNGLALPRPPVDLHRVAEDGFGFPSGHATATAGLAFSLAAVSRWGSASLRWTLATLAVAVIAATRVLLGVHFLVDVVVGAMVGLTVVLLGRRMTEDHLAETYAVLIVVSGLGLVLRFLH